MTETPQEPQEPQSSPEPPGESPAPAAGSLLKNFTYGHVFLAGGALLLVLSGLIPAHKVIGLRSLFVPFVAGILCCVIVFLQIQKGQSKAGAAWALLLGAAGAGAGLNAFFSTALFGYFSPPFIVYLSIVGGIAVLLAAKAALSDEKKGLAEFFARKLK